LVVDSQPTDEPWNSVPIDLRVDDNADPIGELHRLLELQRAHEDGNWAALADSAPAGNRELYMALEAAQRGDAAAARNALADLKEQPGMDAMIRRMRSRSMARPRESSDSSPARAKTKE
jgi:hypothetical protein